jgi:hypothetical protein
MGELQLLVRPHEFFYEKVTQALANQQVRLSDEVEFYVVNLLCEFIVPGKLETVTGQLDALATPLALMLKEAVEAPPAQKLRIFKYLGDTSLYYAGFFQDYFNRKAFNLDYYIAIGASAYSNVSTIMRDQHGDDQFTEIYSGLAEKFDTIVEVVAEVSETPGAAKPIDLLAIYDRWTRNHSDRLARLLNKAGITPIPMPVRDKQ